MQKVCNSLGGEIIIRIPKKKVNGEKTKEFKFTKISAPNGDKGFKKVYNNVGVYMFVVNKKVEKFDVVGFNEEYKSPTILNNGEDLEEGNIFYVGKASDVQSRINHHWTDDSNKSKKNVSLKLGYSSKASIKVDLNVYYHEISVQSTITCNLDQESKDLCEKYFVDTNNLGLKTVVERLCAESLEKKIREEYGAYFGE